MDTYDAEKELIGEYKLSDQQAKFCILVISGVKPIDAVKQSYNYTKHPNAYAQLKALVNNPKIENALRSLGFNLKSKFEKNAVAIVTALEEIAFSDKTSARDRLSALKELAAYNPLLITNRKKDAEDTEEEDMIKRIKESFDG